MAGIRPQSVTALAHYEAKAGRPALFVMSQKTCRRPAGHTINTGVWRALLATPRGGGARRPLYLFYKYPPSMANELLRTLLCGGCLAVVGAGRAVCAPQLPDTLAPAEALAARRLAGIGQAVQVQRFDAEALRLRGVNGVADALRRMAGVNLRDYGGAGGIKTVSVRGLGAAHTVVAYDGLCVASDRSGQTDLQRYSADALGSIELQTLDAMPLLCPVRNLGAAVLYLQSASSPLPHAGLCGNASLKQASFSTWNPALQLALRPVGKATRLTLGGEWFKARNDYPFTVENGVATERLKRTNSRMESTRVELGSHTILRHGTLQARAYVYHNHRRLPGLVRLYVNENNERLTETNTFGQLYWQAAYGRWQVFAAGKWNWQRSLYDNISDQYPGGAQRQHYWQREGYATAGASYGLGGGVSMAVATDYSLATFNGNQTTDHHVARNVWLQSVSLRWERGPWQLTARGVGHFSDDRVRGGESARSARRIMPSLTASYRLSDKPWLYLRAGYKESFRSPTFNENYYYHYGDTQLKPEWVRQLSAGLTLQASPTQWWPVLALTADAYVNRVNDRIVSIPYNLFIWRTVNLARVDAQGTDLTLESRWVPAQGHLLLLAANYSWQRVIDHTERTSQSYGQQLAYMPRHSGAASIAWQNPWLSVVTSLTWAAERWATSAHVAGTRLAPWHEWGVALWRSFALRDGRSVDLRADVINILDARYEIVARYPMPGRSYSAKVRYNF